MSISKAFVIAKPLVGEIKKDNFKIVDMEVPAVQENEVKIKLLHCSVDPYLRGAFASSPVDTVISNFVVGEIIESKNPQYNVGDIIHARLPLMSIIVTQPGLFFKIDKSLGIPLQKYVGVLGMPAQTAFGALFKEPRIPLKKGGVVLISGAAGMVGSCFGQLAKIFGASRVIGIAGGKDKCDIVKNDFGFDECIDYKEFNEDQHALQAKIQEVSPNGIDYYFDNVGGFISAAVWPLLNKDASVCICGQIAHYNETKPSKLDNWLKYTIYNTVTIKGIIFADYAVQPTFFQEFFSNMIPLLQSNKLVSHETVLEGFEKLPEAFVGLFEGKNVGKMVVSL